MKRLLTVLLLLAVLFAAFPCAAYAEESVGTGAAPVGISTVADLRNIANNPSGSYILNNDLDLADENWVPFSFSGTLDGNGHTIYNLLLQNTGSEKKNCIDRDGVKYAAEFSGLFSIAENAEIRNLQLKGLTASFETGEELFVGGIVGYMENTEITGCYVEGRLRITSKASHAGIGGLVGYGSGKVSDCTCFLEAQIIDQKSEPRSDKYLGGIQAVGFTEAKNCNVTLDGYMYCKGEIHGGGIIGMFGTLGLPGTVFNVSDNHAEGQITFFQRWSDNGVYLGKTTGETRRTDAHFTNNTGKLDVTQELNNVIPSPEKCEQPEIEEKKNGPYCDAVGWTEHTCKGCGYSWKDTYTLPSHVPGEWQKKGGQPGVEIRVCSICGIEMEERTVSYYTKEEMLQLTTHELAMNYKKNASLGVVSADSDFGEGKFEWTSSDPEVVTVDRFGTLYAKSVGTAVITCTSEDMQFSDSCTVQVSYSTSQQLIRYLLFGWLWY